MVLEPILAEDWTTQSMFFRKHRGSEAPFYVPLSLSYFFGRLDGYEVWPTGRTGPPGGSLAVYGRELDGIESKNDKK